MPLAEQTAFFLEFLFLDFAPAERSVKIFRGGFGGVCRPGPPPPRVVNPTAATVAAVDGDHNYERSHGPHWAHGGVDGDGDARLGRHQRCL